MAKVAFSKIKTKIDTHEIPITIGEETILVKQYLPISEKLQLIGRVVEQAHEQDRNFHNPVKAKVYQDLEILYAYTNLSFTDKQKEDTAKLYDAIVACGILEQVYAAIPDSEKTIIMTGILDTVEAVYSYQNSVMGLVEMLYGQYANAAFDVEALKTTLAQLEESPVIQQVLPLMGPE